MDKILKAGDIIESETEGMADVMKEDMTEEMFKDTTEKAHEDTTEELPENTTEKMIEDMIDERILRAVKEMGFEKFSPIQEQAIPCLLNGEDMIGQAQTGTGKTAAFGIPVLQKVDPELRKLQAIILCPTRELAIQAAEELRKIAKYMHGIKVLPVYGGQEIGKQIMGLKGTQIIVGTPGRVMDHMRRHTIKLDNINMVVLDEADEMLNMGFREDMELILGQIEREHQTALFSATMPKPILEITDRFQKEDARFVKVAAEELTIPLVTQYYYRVKNQDKDAACIRLLEYYQPALALIFCNTKMKVDELAEVLKKSGFRAEGLHGDMSQHQRDVAMRRFRNGSSNILIATDVAARGIDVENVAAVINYDLPQDIEYYVHRIGRTGRAGKTGRSFTFVPAREVYRIRQIEKLCNTTIEEKSLPGASKVLRSKAHKYLCQAWELHEHEDIELMKKLLSKKMEEEGCDALELAATMLKLQVGDKGEEIEEDKPIVRERRFGGFGRGRGREEEGGRSRGRGHGRNEAFGRGRRGREEENGRGRRGREEEDGRGRRRGEESDRSRGKYRGKNEETGRERNRSEEFNRSRRNNRDREKSGDRKRYGSLAFAKPKKRKENQD